MGLIIGTSGWQYRHWREAFYPPGLAQAHWLEYYAERFATVESNAAFYRLPAAEVFARWAAVTPADFAMAVKASRYITHVRRLRDPQQPVALLVERVRQLGSKRGPILIQLPPDMRVDVARLRDILSAFPADWRLTVEFRHSSWFSDEVRRVLQAHRAALCLADRRGPLTPVWRTASWTYLRLHAGRAQPEPCYGRRARSRWVDRLAAEWSAGEDVFVFFNNDPRACAVRDCHSLALAARRAGVPATRTPPPRDVHLT